MESGSLKPIYVSDKLAPDFHRNRIFVFVISPFPAMGPGQRRPRRGLRPSSTFNRPVILPE